ncbi:MAG: hypothetical protein M1826_002303 [Phylliscum demangeonii]|nr:MAG: hypothetical protein M1826_002303 [Phylliscum demangeonii]
MAEDIATPRVSAAYLSSFTNQTVRIIGRVVQLRGEQAIIDTSPKPASAGDGSDGGGGVGSGGGTITATLPRDSHLTLNDAVEVVAKVLPDLTIKVLVATDLGSEIDFRAVDAVVDATHRYKEIFYEPAGHNA